MNMATSPQSITICNCLRFPVGPMARRRAGQVRGGVPRAGQHGRREGPRPPRPARPRSARQPSRRVGSRRGNQMARAPAAYAAAASDPMSPIAAQSRIRAELGRGQLDQKRLGLAAGTADQPDHAGRWPSCRMAREQLVHALVHRLHLGPGNRPGPRTRLVVTTPSRIPADRSRAVAATAPGSGWTSSGRPLYGTSRISAVPVQEHRRGRWRPRRHVPVRRLGPSQYHRQGGSKGAGHGHGGDLTPGAGPGKHPGGRRTPRYWPASQRPPRGRPGAALARRGPGHHAASAPGQHGRRQQAAGAPVPARRPGAAPARRCHPRRAAAHRRVVGVARLGFQAGPAEACRTGCVAWVAGPQVPAPVQQAQREVSVLPERAGEPLVEPARGDQRTPPVGHVGGDPSARRPGPPCRIPSRWACDRRQRAPDHPLHRPHVRAAGSGRPSARPASEGRPARRRRGRPPIRWPPPRASRRYARPRVRVPPASRSSCGPR